ncbi:MAG TPA: hypothetical protein VMB52_03125 [Verrucomicrobiae bacterium]|nr:hypothetical protein [Verrucomicrobiae bacterium]
MKILDAVNHRFISFYQFWYKFIIGDDWIIAVTIMWSLLAMYSITPLAVDVWYAMPLLVTFLLVWSLNRAFLQYDNKRKDPTKHSRNLLAETYRLGTLILIIVTVPYDLALAKYGYLGSELAGVLILFSVLNISIVMAVSVLLVLLLKERPLLRALTAGVATLLLMQRVRPHILTVAKTIGTQSLVTIWMICLGCVLLTGVCLALVVGRTQIATAWRAVRQSLLNSP